MTLKTRTARETLLARTDLGAAPTVGAINMQVRTGSSVPFDRYMISGAAPAVSAIDMQVRTGSSVPFNAYMVPGDAPSVDAINTQVRTGVSVPFNAYMTPGDAPTVDAINTQVRTGVSVPFATYMVSSDSPSVDPINTQVRTGVSVPYAGYMKGRSELGATPTPQPIDMQVRTGSSVPFNSYMLGAHAEELLKKRIMISPVLVEWTYQIASDETFKGWLSTKEILLSETRMGGDAEIRGVRYGGTYRVADRVAGEGAASVYKTLWGYTSEASMHSMHTLCSGETASATLVQLELIDFVKGLKTFIAEAGDEHFAQTAMVSVAAG